MIRSYKQNPELESSYDAICIGSGLGSLTTAVLLSKEGLRVLVLEKHYTAGGFTHVFKRKNYEWDVGIHYVGEMQRDGSLMKRLFDHVTDGQLSWADMGEVYDRIVIGENKYDLVKGVANFKARLKEYFPEEKEAIDRYVDLVFKATGTASAFYGAKLLPDWMSSLAGNLLSRRFYKYSDRTTYEVLRTLTANEELIKVLCGQYGDYGLPPKKSSFIMHATLVRHYFGGGSYPVGGSSSIVKAMSPLIHANGGLVLTTAEVDQVLVHKGRAQGVRMKDGKEIHARSVISGTGVFNTFLRLLPLEVAESSGMRRQLKKVRPSVSHACLYLGLKGSPEQLGLPKTNYWIYPETGDHDTCVERYLNNLEQEFPVVYISFPAAKDPDWTARHPGRSTIEIITLVPYEAFAPWNGSRWMKRGDNYLAFKEKITQRLLRVLFREFPHLEGKIEHAELSTPLSTKHFANYAHGEIYGLDHSPQRFRQRFLRPRTPLKGLYLTGQDIVTAGIGGALFSGLLTASAVTGKNMLKRV